LERHDHGFVDGTQPKLAPHQAAAADRDHRSGIGLCFEQLAQLFALGFAELGLALLAEDARDRGGETRLDSRIQIDEGSAG